MDQHPDSEIIDRLGGPARVAALCGIRPQAVSQWRHPDAGIPKARRMYLKLVRPDVFPAGDQPSASAEQQAAA